MGADQIIQVGKWVFVADDTGYWKWVRLVVFVAIVGFILWVWLCKGNVGPHEHGIRKRFNRYQFAWFDGLEETPKLRLKWWQVKNDAQYRFWLRAKLVQHGNSRKAKDWRNSPDGNKPHEQLQFGTPVIRGPGWYTTGPKEKGQSIETLDSRNRIVDVTLYVKQEDGFEVFILPIQLTVRIANLYLWLQICNDTEGAIMGDIRMKSWDILDLGYETIRKQARLIAQKLLDSIRDDADSEGSVNWYGGEAVHVKPAPPEYQPISFVAQALGNRPPDAADFQEKTRAMADLDRVGAAVTVAMSIQKDESDDPPVDTAA